MELRNEVKVSKHIKDGNIVDEYNIGNTRIKICDAAYANKTTEDVNRILERVISIGWKCVNEARAAGKDI